MADALSRHRERSNPELFYYENWIASLRSQRRMRSIALLSHGSQSQIRLPDIRIDLHFGRRSLHQQPAGLQDVGTVGDIKAFGHALLDDQDREAGVADALHRLEDFVDE